MMRKKINKTLIISMSIIIAALFIATNISSAVAQDAISDDKELDERKLARLEELRAARAEEEPVEEITEEKPVLTAISIETTVIEKEKEDISILEKPVESSIKEVEENSCPECAITSDSEFEAKKEKYSSALTDLADSLAVLSDEQLQEFIDMFEEMEIDGVKESYYQLSKIEKVGANNFMASKLDRLMSETENDKLKEKLMKSAEYLRRDSISLRHQAEIQQYVEAEGNGLFIAGVFELGGGSAVATGSTSQSITGSSSAGSCGPKAQSCDSQRDEMEAKCQSAYETAKNEVLDSIQDRPLLTQAINGILDGFDVGPITRAVIWTYITVNHPWLMALLGSTYLDGILDALNAAQAELESCFQNAKDFWTDCISGEGPCPDIFVSSNGALASVMMTSMPNSMPTSAPLSMEIGVQSVAMTTATVQESGTCSL